MNLLDFLKRLSPDECREVGELFVFAADCPRNAAFHAHIEAAAAKFRDPKEENLVAHVEVARERIRRLEEPLNRDGLNHRRLIEEELARRGDSRSVADYLHETGAAGGSDVLNAWLHAS